MLMQLSTTAERPKVEFQFIGEGSDWSQLPL